MKRSACAILILSLAVAGCGRSESANAPASADNVEMPAEDAIRGVSETPIADPSATATTQAPNPASNASSDANPVSPDGGADSANSPAVDANTSNSHTGNGQ